MLDSDQRVRFNSYGFADRHIRPLCQSTIAEGIPLEENPVKDNRFSRPLPQPCDFTLRSSSMDFHKDILDLLC